MRSTNTQRLSVCVSAASGQQKATTLARLNRRVAQVYAGRTKAIRQAKRTTVNNSADLIQFSSRVDSLSAHVGSQFAALTCETSARVDLSPPNASDPGEADRGDWS